MKTRFEIRPPFDFALSLKFARCCRFETSDEKNRPVLRRLIQIGDVPLYIKVKCLGSVEEPIGEVEWMVLDKKKIDKRHLLSAVRRILSADLETTAFYKLAVKSPRLKPLVARLRGLKPILTPTPFESAAWAIMGQQVNLTFAETLKTRLVDKYGTHYNIDGLTFSLFPTPDIISKARPATLRKFQFSTRKAEYLIDLARAIRQKTLDLERLEKLEYEKAVAQLIVIRGLGVWSANYILMRGAGHKNCLPLGDTGLHQAAKTLFRLKNLPDNDKISALAKPFAPYRSLFTLYLWYSLIAGEEA